MISKEIIDQVKAANPRDELRLINLRDPSQADPSDPGKVHFECIAKVPVGPIYQKYLAMLRDETQRPGASRALVEECVVYPPQAELQTALHAHPGFVGALTAEITKLGGAEAKAESVKI